MLYVLFKSIENALNESVEIENYELKIHNDFLPIVTHTKLLGIVIYDKLSWGPHIKALAKKLSCCTGSLNQIIESVPKDPHENL